MYAKRKSNNILIAFSFSTLNVAFSKLCVSYIQKCDVPLTNLKVYVWVNVIVSPLKSVKVNLFFFSLFKPSDFVSSLALFSGLIILTEANFCTVELSNVLILFWNNFFFVNSGYDWFCFLPYKMPKLQS